MRHGKVGKKFHRERGQRQALFRSMVSSLVRHGHIETTEARAKAIRPMVERAITLAKKQDVAHRRLLIARLHDTVAVHKLCDELAARFQDRRGGYTRIIKSGIGRKRDGSRLARIELIV